MFDELRRASAGGIADYAGISYARIEAEQGVFWPCPSEDHPGTPRLFADTFPTADGRARFIRVDHRDPAELPDARYPYVLTTGRLMGQYQSGTQTRRVPSPAQAQVQPEAQLHPDLARRLDIGPADIVQLSSRRGTANFRAKITDEIRPDTIFVPFHWGGLSARERAHQRRPRPALADAGLQGLRRVRRQDRRAGRRRAARTFPAGRIPRPGPDRRRTAARRPGRFPGHPTRSTRPRSPLREDRTVLTKNRFLQGIYPFEGAGFDKPVAISPELSHLVPDGAISQALYFRGGNTTDQLVVVVMLRDGVPMRYFPIGAKADVHVPLRVVEDIDGGSVLELRLIAPLGLVGHLVVDLGLVEH